MDEATWMALMQYLMGMGYLGPQSFVTGGGSVPGGGEPSSDQKRAIDFAQDYNSYLADPMLGALAGPQAIDAAAFQPTIEREEVDLPGRRMLTDWRNRNEGTVQQIIADEIYNGGDAASAFAIISNIVTGTPTTEEEALLKETLTASLPKMYMRDDVSNTLVPGGPDLDKVWAMAEELDRAVSSDPLVDEYDETGLRGYNVTETPSALQEKFNELGLPSPFEQYTYEGAMGPQWEQDQRRLGDLQQEIYARGLAQNQERRQADDETQRAMARLVTPEFERAPAPTNPLPNDFSFASATEPEVQDAIRQSVLGAGATPAWSGADTDIQYAIDRATLGEEAAQERYAQRVAAGLTGVSRDLAPQMPREVSPIVSGAAQNIRERLESAVPRLRGTTKEDVGRYQRNQAASGFSKRRAEEADMASYRAKKKRQEPSATMEAYRKFFNEFSNVNDRDSVMAHREVFDALRSGRTPLSDTLAARRAQGVIAGVPIGWGG